MYKVSDVELHKKGINIVCNDLIAQGYESVEANYDPETVPQISAKKNGQACLFLVATERLPKLGELDEAVGQGLANSSINNKTLAYFVSVGIEDLGEQSRVATSEPQIITIDMPLPTDEQYSENYPTRVLIDRAPKFPELHDVKVVWRTNGRSVVEGGDWRYDQWEGLFKGFDREKNTVMIRFTDGRIAAEIREFWYKIGFNDPLFEVPAAEVWLADDEIYKLAPQITRGEIRQLIPDLSALPEQAAALGQNSAQQAGEKKPWWKVW